MRSCRARSIRMTRAADSLLNGGARRAHRLAVAHVRRAGDRLRGALAHGRELREAGVRLGTRERDAGDRDRHDRELALDAEAILRLDVAALAVDRRVVEPDQVVEA